MKSRSTNGRPGTWRRYLAIFVLSITVGSFSIHSQPISNSEGRWVSYDQLNEFAKFVAYKSIADSLLAVKDQIILTQEKSISSLTDVINRFETQIVPSFESQIRILQDKISAKDDLMNITLDQHKAEIQKIRRRRLGIGAYAGYGATPQNLQPSIGISIHYSLIRI